MLLLVTKSQPEMERYAHPHLGRLIQPRHTSSIERTAASGVPWAADNDCYQALDVAAYTAMLERIQGLPGCLFVTCPDVVGDHEATLRQFRRHAPGLARRGLPIAFVLQDGCTINEVPWWDVAAVFIGGSTEFKLSSRCEEIVRYAKALRRGYMDPVWVHMGRVNSRKRIRYAQEIGCDSADGTKWSRFNETFLDRGLAFTAAAAARDRQHRLL